NHGGIPNDGSINVRVVHHGSVHVQHGGVIGKMSAFPAPAEEAHAAVAVTIVNPAVKADVGPPVTGVPGVDAAAKPPIAGGPEKSGPWSQHPGPRHPEVT